MTLHEFQSSETEQRVRTRRRAATSEGRSPEWSSRDPLIVCGARHSAWFQPRPLCTVGGPIGGDRQPSSLLDVAVSACAPDESEAASPALIILRGELDTYCAAKIHDPLQDYAEFAHDIVLDLSLLCTIDSGGVMLVEALHRSLIGQGGSLTIHDPSFMVERVLQICGADETITLCRPSPDPPTRPTPRASA